MQDAARRGVRAGEIEIRLLGRFSVLVDGEEVPPPAFGGRLVRALLRLLLIRRGAYVSKDALTEALWPGRAPSDPAANLDVLVSRARRALGDPTLIVAGSGGYSFARDDRCIVDAEAFRADVEAGQAAMATGAAARAFPAFQAGLDRWTGEALAEDTYADWAQAYRGELARVYLNALEGAATAALGTGMAARAVIFAERAVAREPLREAGHLLLARALAESGDAAGALGVIGAFRKRFADELGLDLPAEAVELELQILRGGQALPAAVHPPLVTAPQAASPALAFVGRGEEMGRLLAALAAPDPAFVAVSGRSGTGKSRLLAEATARLAMPVITVRAFRPEADEPWSLARALVEGALSLDVGAVRAISARAAQVLADLVPAVGELRPDLAGGTAAAIDAESRRALLLEASVRIVQQATGDRSAVLVDDLQWADPTSLALLTALPRRCFGLGLAVAYRPEELARSGAVASFLDDAGATGRPFVQIDIGPLPETAIPGLVADDAIVRAIVEETDRSPFAVAEVLRELTEQGAGAPSASGRWQSRSERAAALATGAARRGQREAVLARIRWQPPRRRELLALLGLLGREVPARVLQVATRADPAALGDDLDTLARAGLARAGEGGWASGHDLVGEAAVDALAPGEAVRLHGVLAAVLADVGAEPAELGRHRAAAGDRPGAAAAYLEAGRRALEGYASNEAATLAGRGLALVSEPAVRVGLLGVRAEARTRRGELREAREDLTAAVAVTRSGRERARLMARLALLTSGATDLSRAADLVDRSLAEAGDDADARAEALYAGAIVDMNAGAPGRASQRYAEALSLFEQAGNARGMADILDGQAMAELMEGRIAQGAESLGRVARLFLDSGDLIRFIWPQGARGAALGWMLRGDEGLVEIDKAMEIALALGHREGECYCLLERALTLGTLGRAAEAGAAARDALDIAESLGHTEWTVASLLALGAAHLEGGELVEAADALRRCLAIAQPGQLAHFTAWAEALLARVLIAAGALGEADGLVTHALSADTPMAHHYARLARAELAAARGDPETATIAATALALAEAAGHFESAAKLRALLPL